METFKLALKRREIICYLWGTHMDYLYLNLKCILVYKFKMKIWWQRNATPLSSQTTLGISEFCPLTLLGVSLLFQVSLRAVSRVNKYGMDSTVSSLPARCLGSKGFSEREHQAGASSRLSRVLYQVRNITVKKLQPQHWHKCWQHHFHW